MLKLIRLEYSKNSFSKWVRSAAVMMILVSAFSVCSIFTFDIPATSAAEIMTNISILVFASCMHAMFTIGAYKNKTIELMFSYPIDRKKIVVAKMLAVLLFSFIASIIMRTLMYVIITILNYFIDPAVNIIDFDFMRLSFYLSSVFNSTVYILLSMIALFVGVLNKSTIAAVVTSFILATFLNGGVSTGTVSYSLKDTIAPLICTLISIACMIIMVNSVEKKDFL